jgi:hypothetical protein
MNPDTTPTKSRPPLPPPPPYSRNNKSQLSSTLQPDLIMGLIASPPLMGTIAPIAVPTHGGTHGTHGVFLGGGAVELGWLMSKACYCFSTQRRDKCSVSKVEHGLIDARDKTTTLKFNGTLELEMKEGTGHELDMNWTWNSSLEQLSNLLVNMDTSLSIPLNRED